MSADAKLPDRPSTFIGAAGQETRVGPEAAIAASLPLEGRLEEASSLRLCYLVAANQATGSLGLEAAGVRYQLFFKKGVLEHVQSSAPEDGIAAFLRRKGLVTAEHVADAEKAMGGFGGDLFTALAGLRIIDPAKTFPALQEHGAGLAARTLAADAGSWRWEPGAAGPPSGFPLLPRWALVCEAARRIDGLALRKRLAPSMDRAPARAGGRVAISDLKLTAQEVRLAGTLDGARSLAELVEAAGPEADALLRVTLVLRETELVSFGAPRAGPPAPRASRPVTPAPGKPAPAPVAPAAKPAPATPAAKPAPATPRPAAAPARPATPAAPVTPPPGAIPADLDSLRLARERLEGADHFEALGVARNAGAAQIKAAYFALARAWHPDSAPQGDPQEARQLRADLFARVSEAWGVLGDEAQRKQYLEDLLTGATNPVDIAGIMEAESTFQRATILVKTRQYPEAMAELDKAIALNADEPEFHVWRAWVVFLVAKDRKKQMKDSGAEIERALKKVPRCMAGYLFLGLMAKICGDVPLAEKHFRRGLAVEPEDAELVRELKYLKR